MLQTVEAEVDVNGYLHWLEPVQITKTTRALVTLLNDNTETTDAEKENLEGIGASMKANSFTGNPPRFNREGLPASWVCRSVAV